MNAKEVMFASKSKKETNQNKIGYAYLEGLLNLPNSWFINIKLKLDVSQKKYCGYISNFWFLLP